MKIVNLDIIQNCFIGETVYSRQSVSSKENSTSPVGDTLNIQNNQEAEQ